MADKRASVEAVARTVEEAIEQGLVELGLTREQVDVQVVNPGRAGVLGLGAQDAVVRVIASEPEHQDLGASSSDEDTSDLAEDVEMVEDSPEDEGSMLSPISSTVEESDVADLARMLLQGIIDRMGIRGEVVVRSGEDLVEEGEPPPLILDVTGKDLGILIGRQGETLQSLQYLTRLMLSRQLERWEPVVVDVESYRARRRLSLHRLAERMAERVANSGRRVMLEAMPAYERRIVHLALRDHPDVTTRSVGEGDSRKVTILPK
jgi:spoIIIJ-associated protein